MGEVQKKKTSVIYSFGGLIVTIKYIASENSKMNSVFSFFVFFKEDDTSVLSSVATALISNVAPWAHILNNPGQELL